jgi:hypothetical protein
MSALVSMYFAPYDVDSYIRADITHFEARLASDESAKAGATPPASVVPLAPVPLEGTWTLTIRGPTGAHITKLVIQRTEIGFTGSQTGQGSTSPITDVQLDGNKVSWVNEATVPMRLHLHFSGVIEGATISGKVKVSFMGSYPFTGVKE